jgi:hypothetical protein
MTDVVFFRTMVALLRSFPASNGFWLSRLAGRDERETARILAKLAVEGLAVAADDKWSLTPAGREAFQPHPYVETRPLSVTRARRVRIGKRP